MADFKPSQVRLDPVPLVATMGSSGRELAAAVLVYACQQLGDAWQAVPIRELGRVLIEAIDENRPPVACWARNPFMRPDLEDLWIEGYADAEGEAPDQTLAFNERGFAALKRYVREEAP